MEIKKGDIVKYFSGSSIYKITKTPQPQDENKVYEITHTDGRIFKLEEYRLTTLIRLDLSIEDFEKLPPKKIDYPDWTGVNPHRRVEDLDGEKWFEVKGYEDCYSFSNKGRVKSLNSNGLRDNHLILSYRGSYENGHEPTVQLYKDGRGTDFTLEDIALISLPDSEYKPLKEKRENEFAEYIKNIEELKN